MLTVLVFILLNSFSSDGTYAGIYGIKVSDTLSFLTNHTALIRIHGSLK